MNIPYSFSDMLENLEDLEFPYCDIAHEDHVRKPDGEVLEIGRYVDECPTELQDRRPACPHCCSRQTCEEHSPLFRILSALEESDYAGKYDGLFNEFQGHTARLIELDKEIRSKRTYGEPHAEARRPSATEARAAAADLVKEHRRIVDWMRNTTQILIGDIRAMLDRC